MSNGNNFFYVRAETDDDGTPIGDFELSGEYEELVHMFGSFLYHEPEILQFVCESVAYAARERGAISEDTYQDIKEDAGADLRSLLEILYGNV